jgi:hypothetical protein
MRRSLPLIFSIFTVISYAEMSWSNTIERKSFLVGKTKVIEVLQRDSQSKVLRRSLITPEIIEISFYDPQTTSPTAWIVKNAEREIEAKYPIDGIFRRLQLKKRNGNSEDRFVFIYNTLTESYRLIDSENIPDKIYQRAFDDVRITRGQCRTSAINDLRAPFEEIAELLGQARDEAQFLERLNQPDAARKLFDRSCLESSESTLGAAEDMARTKEALAEIMGSHIKQDPSRYLKCMTDQGLSLHAARIEAIVIGAVEHNTNVLNRRRSLITCEPNIISRDLAHYNVTNGQINISRKPSQMLPELMVPDILDSAVGLSPTLPASQVRQNLVREEIGKTLFHELIHASGIEEENFVEDITLCCGNGFREDLEPCRRMRSEVDRLERVQTAEILLKGGEWPWYNQVQEQLTRGDVTAESKRAFDKAFAAEFHKEWTKSRQWGPECYESPEAQVECNEKFGKKFRETIKKRAVSLCHSKISLKQEPPTLEEFCGRINAPSEVPRIPEPPLQRPDDRVFREPTRQPSPTSGSAPKPNSNFDSGSGIGVSTVPAKIPARLEKSEVSRAPATLELPRDLDRGINWQHGAQRNEFSGRAFRDTSGSFVSPLGSPRPDLQRDIERPRQLIETMSRLVDQAGLTIPQARADSHVNQSHSAGSFSRARSPASDPVTEAETTSSNKVQSSSRGAQINPGRASSSGVRSGRPTSSVSSNPDDGTRPLRKRKKKAKEKEEESQTTRRVSSSSQGFVPETATRLPSTTGSLQLIATIEKRPEAVQDLLQSARFQESLIRNKILLIDADQREYGARDPEQVYRYNPRTRKYEKEQAKSSEDPR